MPGRQGTMDAKTLARELWYIDASFMTAGTSQPTVGPSNTLVGNTLRGEGITTITRTAAGVFLVTLDWGMSFREVITKTADLEGPTGSNGDGAYSTIGNMTNEGATGGSSALPLVFNVYTHTAGGTLTDFGPGGTGVARRLSIMMCLKAGLSGK
jgi:hypothetical protein